MRFDSLCRDINLRFDAKAVHLFSKLDQVLHSAIPLYAIAEIREPVSCGKPTEPFFYHEISTIDEYGIGDPYLIDESNIERGSEEERVLSKVYKGDIGLPQAGIILIPRVRPQLGKFVLVKNDNGIYYTTSFLEARPKGISAELLYCVLKHPVVLAQINRIVTIGKGYPTISAFDLARFVRVPAALLDVGFSTEKEIGEELNEVFNRLSKLQKERPIIDTLIAQRLNYPSPSFSSMKAFVLSQSNLVMSFDLRSSAHFVHPSRIELIRFFQGLDTVKIISLCAIPISLGISPELGVEESQYYYLGPQAMTKERLNPEKLGFISEKYYKSQIPFYSVKKGDVFLRRSGASLGKILHFDTDLPCIFSDFMMRIRFRDPLIGKFGAYWMRSTLFQCLVKATAIIGKGLQNIYPYQVEVMPILNPNKYDVTELVSAIDKGMLGNNSLKAEVGRRFLSLEERLSLNLDFLRLGRVLL